MAGNMWSDGLDGKVIRKLIKHMCFWGLVWILLARDKCT